MATIKLNGLKKTYGKDVHILKGIDVEIKDGEFLVLVGPSGCGKSTLLRCIAGLEEITGGDLYIDDKLVNNVAPKDRDLAMVFQSYALYPHLTVRENMGFSLQIQKRPKAEIIERVDAAAKMLGLTDLLERLPKQLSGGQRQRVAIGRAIVRKPKVFLFDEPLSNLDANLRAQMRVELKKLHQKLGVTMIYVTHDQIEAMTLADRICVLEGGWARQVDSPLNLYDKPNSKFVAEFIGSPPMNFMDITSIENGMMFGENMQMPLPEGMNESQLGDGVIIGIRPHELNLDDDGDGYVEAEIDVVETVGWDLHLHARIGEKKIIAQVEAEKARGLKPGETCRFRVDSKKVKLFNKKSERAIMKSE